MKELDFIHIIKNALDNSSYIGDDCAYLKEFGIFITQDTLVENVHFSLYTTNPYLLGRKAVSVNLSDLAASLSQPCYITLSISLPKHINSSFVAELYRGINDVCREFGVKVAGGDITSSDKVVISVCAIGKKVSDFFSSRCNAKKDDYILVTGDFASSAAGLFALENFLYAEKCLVDSHLNPVPRLKESNILAESILSNVAVMDASDGLADALYKIAVSSKHNISIDINKVPVKSQTIEFFKRNNLDYKKFIKWGGEDFELVICVSSEIYSKLDKKMFTLIGKVQNKDINPCVFVKDEAVTEKITDEIFQKNSFNHFGAEL